MHAEEEQCLHIRDLHLLTCVHMTQEVGSPEVRKGFLRGTVTVSPGTSWLLVLV